MRSTTKTSPVWPIEFVATIAWFRSDRPDSPEPSPEAARSQVSAIESVGEIFLTANDDRIDALTELVDNTVDVIQAGPPLGRVEPGVVAAEAGQAAVDAVRTAVEMLKHDHAAARATAPLNKAAMHAAGTIFFPGHTELLAHEFGVNRVSQMRSNSRKAWAKVSAYPTRKSVYSVSTRTLARVACSATKTTRAFVLPSKPRSDAAQMWSGRFPPTRRFRKRSEVGGNL
jgi:4-hydroxy-L-threonine phosphate dehydrogenase PdxA